MKETLLVYDNNGKVFFHASKVNVSDLAPVGLPNLIFVIPEGKRLIDASIQVDVTSNPHQPILVDVPKSDVEESKEIIEELSAAVMELGELIAQLLEGGNE